MSTEHTAAVVIDVCSALVAFLVGRDVGGPDNVAGVGIGSLYNNYYHCYNFADVASLPAVEQKEVVQKNLLFKDRTGKHSLAFQRLGYLGMLHHVFDLIGGVACCVLGAE